MRDIQTNTDTVRGKERILKKGFSRKKERKKERKNSQEGKKERRKERKNE